MAGPRRPADDVATRQIRKEQPMVDDILERRALELLIRRAEAEERLLERRLERMATDQMRTRRSIDAELGQQPWSGLLG
jgi:hypothetical protein